uniref:Uncharacterized protein n=1 Tax=Bionectria ochroleuca TaxID=29856 RepID=A0A8H7NBI0_BIOOC
MASPNDTEMASCTCRHRKAFIGIDMGATHAGISCVTYEDCQACGKTHDKVLHRTLVDKFPVLLAADSSLSNFRFTSSFQRQSHAADIIRYINKTTLDIVRYHGRDIVVELVKAYIDGLIKLMLEKMAEAFPRIQKEDMKIILTYPKFFQSSTGKAFSHFSQAIDSLDMEGIPSIDKLPEHNAALKASLYFAAGDLWRHHMANEWVVVADCGGMTVDTVLYRIPAPNTVEDATEFQQLNSTLGGGATLKDLAWRGDDDLFETRVQQVMNYWHEFIKPEFTTGRTSPPVLNLGNGVLFTYPT